MRLDSIFCLLSRSFMFIASVITCAYCILNEFFGFLDSLHSQRAFFCGYLRRRYCCSSSSSISYIYFYDYSCIFSLLIEKSIFILFFHIIFQEHFLGVLAICHHIEHTGFYMSWSWPHKELSFHLCFVHLCRMV